jgi:hypothetical protein
MTEPEWSGGISGQPRLARASLRAEQVFALRDVAD